jgi:hypothetical protein
MDPAKCGMAKGDQRTGFAPSGEAKGNIKLFL